MHFFSRRNASLALSLAAVGVLAACGDDVTVPVTPPTPVTISITPQSVTLNPGQTGTLSVQITGGEPTPTLTACASSTPGVATAAVSGNGCTVTAVASGNATVTATTSGGQQASAAVTVNQLPAALGDLTVSPATAALSTGQTVQLVPNPNAGPGVQTTYTYVSSAPSIASVNGQGVVTAAAPGVATITVTAVGTGTGFSSATRTFGVTINVSSAPPSLTALNVQPAALNMATGSQQQLTSSVTQPAGATAAAITYSSSNAAVATVSGSGTNANVTAVAPGTATITVTATSPATGSLSATTITQLIPVTVSARATVTIAQLRQGPVETSYGTTSGEGLVTSANAQINQPVDIANVKDQIQVVMTLQPNGQRVDSLVVFIGDANDANRVSAARQVFTDGAANASSIELSVNTAEFTANFEEGTADILFPNGLRVISASVYTTLPDGTTVEIQNASNNRQTVNFNNLDSWAIRFVTPTRVAQGGTDSDPALNWRGGPGTEGQGRFTVVPVFYTPDRTVASFQTFMGQKTSAAVNAGLNAVCSYASPATDRNFTGADLPYRTEYGKALTTGKRISCNGYAHPIADARNLPGITNAVDNFNNPAPIVTIANGYRTAVQNNVLQPVAQRFDYQNPTVVVTSPATRWANRTTSPYNFATNTVVDEIINGVGVQGATPTFTYSGCGSTTQTALPSGTTSEIPECGTNFTNNVYTVTASAADRLGNPATGTTATTFAIDDTPPVIRYSGSTDADMFTYSAAGTILEGSLVIADATRPLDADTLFQLEFLDERSGFAVALDSVAAQHRLSRANQMDNMGNCLVLPPIAPNVIGPLFITNPNCRWAAVPTEGTVLADGFRVAEPVLGNDPIAINATQGYYSYQGRVFDRAGNVAQVPVRKILINNTNPLVSGLGLPSTITAAGPNPFTPNFTELVEVWFTNFRVTYAGYQNPAAAADAPLLFPAQLYNARFNDAIGMNGNLTTGKPFTTSTTFYTNLERVDNTGTVVTAANAPTVTSRPTQAGTVVYNVGGLSSALQNATILDGNVANDASAWKTKNVNLLTWLIGSSTSQFNAPATGLKAVVTANSNQINSPFARVDFYEYSTESAAWMYRGSVDGQAAPCVSPAQNCGVYIADNGADRVWTYRLNEFVRDSVDPVGTGSGIGALGGRNFVAIGVMAGATPTGRALSTSPANSLVPGAFAESFSAITVTPANGTTGNVGISIPLTGVVSYNAPTENATFTCTSSNTTVATVSCPSANVGGDLDPAAVVNPLTPGSVTITITATTATTAGFQGRSMSVERTFTIQP